MSWKLYSVEMARRVFAIDVRALAALRIALGILILADLWMRSEFLTEHYTDAGVMPRDAVSLTRSGFAASLYMLNGSSWFAGLLFVLAGIFALLLIAGYKTRFAVLACLVFTVSLHERNALVCNGGDRLLGILLFWSAFLPLGSVWSVDRQAARSADPPRSVFTPASAGLLLQVVAVYFFSALHKQHPAWNANHVAIYLALSSPYASDLGRQASQWPFQILQLLTAYVFRLELIGWVPAFSPFGTNALRLLVVLPFVGLHLGFAVFMNLGLFAWISIASWLVFLPGPFWDRVEKAHICRAAGLKAAGALAALTDLRRTLPRPPRPAARETRGGHPGFVMHWAPVLVMLYVAGVNVASLYPAVPVPAEVQRWGQRIGIYQRWRMFAPSPRRGHGWYVASAQLADGTSVDLMRPDDPIKTEPASIARRGLRNKFQRCYLVALTTQTGHDQIPVYVRWLRERWDRRQSPERQVRSVDLRFEIEFIMPPGRPTVRTSATLYKWVQGGEERLAPLSELWDAIQSALRTEYGRRP